MTNKKASGTNARGRGFSKCVRILEYAATNYQSDPTGTPPLGWSDAFQVLDVTLVLTW